MLRKLLRVLGIGCGAAALAAIACDTSNELATGGPARDWPEYGGDAGGRRHAALAEITRSNVDRLAIAWTYRTGDLPDSRGEQPSELASEVTPILVDGTLYLCTPYNRVIALDPETGEERWSYDPDIDLAGRYANQLVCRGVSSWRDPQRAADQPCARRIFTATNDARLVALDAASGRPCADFGAAGQVDLNPGVGRQLWRGEYQVTSPPTIGADVVIVGSAVSDNARTDAPSGVVRAYDARSGALRWAWDLAPPGFVRTPRNTTEAGYALASPNVWAPMSIDRERDLLFVPTGNPAPDYFRGDSNLDFYGSSVVALRASTGEVVWSFQTVHRDRWDYDVPAQPTLFDWRRGEKVVPALVQATKMGMLFVLNRETGEPLFGVEERPVPQGGAAGDRLSPTQPFPVRPPPLVRQTLAPEDAWGITPWDRGACRDSIAALRNEGIYTPPTRSGSVVLPGPAGGSNWGGVAVHVGTQRLFANVQEFPWWVKLLPREEGPEDAELEGYIAPMTGTPYRMYRSLLFSPLGVPCIAPPWGSLASVDLARGEILWEVPLGSLRDILPVPIPYTVGTPNLGGPLVTDGGLVFIGAAFDHYLRAFDVETGEEVWRGRLPAGGQATPMTYRVRDGGRQFVVIAAMGYDRGGMRVSDHIVAFALE